MRDHLRRYRAIRDALPPGSPGQLNGHVARHLTTLAALLRGSVGSTRTPLPHRATPVPEGRKPARRVTRWPRGLDTERIVEALDFGPSADLGWAPGAWEPLVVVRDGRGVGRGCPALMRHVIEKGRALPLAWRVRQGPQGPWPEARHRAVVELIRPWIPEQATGVWRGDGACDGTALQATLNAAGWSYVCRTALRTTAPWQGTACRLDTWGACSKPGPRSALQAGQWTRDA